MSISQKLEKYYKNQIKNIKDEQDKKIKSKMIGALIADLGNRSINAVAKYFDIDWRTAKKYYQKFLGKIPITKEARGRKTILSKYPTLKEDIKNIVDDYSSTDPKFKTEKQYVRLTIKEIKKELINTGRYSESSVSNSKLNDIVNELGYNLKKVQKVKPLKKIPETDMIFSNVFEKKKEAMQDENVALISIDTKDKILLGEFSRGGKNRVLIEALDHELTNDCLIPFGILDIKKNTPYFFNFNNRPSSLDMVECIEEFFIEQYKNTNVNKLMILADNCTENNGFRRIFLKGLIEVSTRHNITIELVYYPPYHSKYNPVERLWARLENIWHGELLINIDTCIKYMKNLTWNGIESITKLKEVKYEKGMTIDRKEMKSLEKEHILRDTNIKKYSVVITP